MAAGPLEFVEIRALDDPLLLPWLDLYETAFPPAERVLVSEHLAVLRAKRLGAADAEHLLAAVDPEQGLTGMARYQVVPGSGGTGPVGWLWYLAVVPEARGQGLGVRCYEEIRRRVEGAGCAALLFEVELPEHCPPRKRELARRRIAFYQRLGARLLLGTEYLEDVGPHQPPLPMQVMIHPLTPLTPEEAFQLASLAYGAAVTRAGRLALE